MPSEDQTGREGRAEDELEKKLIEAFLSTYSRLQTRKSYGHDLRDFFGAEEIGPPAAGNATPEALEVYLWETKVEKGQSAARRRRAAVRAFYEWAREERVVSKKRAKKIRAVPVPLSDPKEDG